MATKHLTVSELRDFDRRQFDIEYWKWTEYALHDDWWDGAQDSVASKWADYGVTIESVEFRLSYSQGDGAAFIGRVDLDMFMKAKGLDEQYPALYLGVCDDGSYALIRNRSHHGFSVGVTYECYANQTAPSGVFKDLPQDAWSDLVDEQELECGLEQVVIDTCDEINRQFYDEVQKEYEAYTSEEAFIESCEANEVTFEVEIEEDKPCE